MKNLANMMKQAQEFQNKLSDIQEKMATVEVKGVSAGGMCELMMNGQGEAQRLKIDPCLLNEENVEVLEDLIVAAINDAKTKADSTLKEKMSELTGGLPLPAGFQLPF